MEFIETGIEGLLVIKPRIFKDERGYFFESYNQSLFGTTFHQDNQSLSSKGVLRGLHLQKGEHAQAKLVRVVRGSVLDVAVDLRPNSKTFGKWHSIVLNGEENTMFYIPEGFAHGFYTLEDNTIFQYKCSKPYNKESEGGIIWDDKDLNIDWGLIGEPIVSDKDKLLPTLVEFKNISIF